MPAISFKHPNISKLILTVFFFRNQVYPTFFSPDSQELHLKRSQNQFVTGWWKKVKGLEEWAGPKRCGNSLFCLVGSIADFYIHWIWKKTLKDIIYCHCCLLHTPWKIHILNLKITPPFFRFQPLIFQGVFCFCRVRCRQQFRGPLAPVVWQSDTQVTPRFEESFCNHPFSLLRMGSALFGLLFCVFHVFSITFHTWFSCIFCWCSSTEPTSIFWYTLPEIDSLHLKIGLKNTPKGNEFVFQPSISRGFNSSFSGKA